MTAVSVKPIRFNEDGKRIVEAVLVADSTPDALPTTGENVSGLSKNDIFAPFSLLYVVGTADTKVYIANESGAFVAQ